MNLILECSSVSIDFMHQIFITHKRQLTQRPHFKTPSLLNLGKKQTPGAKVKKNVRRPT